MQVPDPELAKELGVVGYLLIVVVVSGVATIAWFLRRMALAMDKMATTQELTPPVLSSLLAKLDAMEGGLKEAVELAREHVRIAKMWERTEWPGRVGRSPPE